MTIPLLVGLAAVASASTIIGFIAGVSVALLVRKER